MPQPMSLSQIRLRLIVALTGFALTTGLAGCGEEPRGGPRVETTPITGTVTVDGKPASLLLVTCHPIGDSTEEPVVHTTISGFTDAEGHFSIGTYESGDGAPEGEYAVTFKWGQYGMSGRYGGPYKLKKAYDDAEKSEWVATVTAGVPSDLGTIDLETPK